MLRQADAGAELPSCPACYRDVDDDGRIAALAGGHARLDLAAHVAEHERFPVGDDEYLESVRRNDRIRIGRWEAPYDLVRRYLVSGVVDQGRRRLLRHNAIVTAMTQVARWGVDTKVLGDQREWQEARVAVGALMERHHRRH